MGIRLLGLVGVAGLSVFAAAAQPLPPFARYDGVCEASAAVRLDKGRFVVASDETRTLTVYRRGVPAPLSTAPAPDVTDIEAAARVGPVIYWLTSHSLNRSGEDKPKRKLLFATRYDASSGLVPTGTAYGELRKLVAQRLGESEAALTPTLNIEGMAATRAGNLVVGLRAPLDGGRALVVRIDRPSLLLGLTPAGSRGLAARALRADLSGAGIRRSLIFDRVAAVSRLDLGGRGIRSIERVGRGAKTFLIVAGPTVDGGLPKPALFWWDGLNRPTPGPAAALDSMTPEAAIGWSSRHVQILGDNGDGCSDEEPGPRWFPSLELRV